MSKQESVQLIDYRNDPVFTPLAGKVLQRACACGNHSNGEGECADCKKKRELSLQRAASSPAPVHAVPPIVHEVLHSPGHPLDQATRDFMEPRFEHDFSHVRVHTDARAAESAYAVNALAYTVGNNIVFGRGQYAPQNTNGKRLLMHELTHTVQQQNAIESFGNLHIGAIDSAQERQAAANADVAEKITAPIESNNLFALQRQPATRITAPIPRQAVVNKQGQATFTINGIAVIAEPDRNTADEAQRNRAETKFGLVLDQEAGGQYDERTNTISSVTQPQIHATVFTIFGPGYDPRRSATYGRGTTAEDRRAKNTNLGFHESRHGEDWFQFLQQNAAPIFGGKAGISLDDFQKAREQYHNEINAYNTRAQEFSQRRTDCVGTLPKERTLATFCRQQQQQKR